MKSVSGHDFYMILVRTAGYFCGGFGIVTDFFVTLQWNDSGGESPDCMKSYIDSLIFN